MNSPAVGKKAASFPWVSTMGRMMRNAAMSPMYPAPTPMPETMPRCFSSLTLMIREL